jgi:hypothetical protein
MDTKENFFCNGNSYGILKFFKIINNISLEFYKITN